LGQSERARLCVARKPALDTLAVLHHVVPLVARRRQWARLHALRGAVLLVVGQLAIASEPESRGRIRVPCNGLAIDAGLATDPSVALPPRPAAKHFFHVDLG